MIYRAKLSRRLAILRGAPMLSVLCLLAACQAGSAVAGLDPEDPVLNPIIVSIDLRTARASYATDEGALIESKGRLSTGQTVDADTEWLALDGGTVTAVSDGSKALFSSTNTGTFRVVGKGKGWGKGGSGGGGGSTTTDTTAAPADTVTIIVAPAPAPLASISVTPATDTVYRGWTQKFTVTGTRTDGSSATPMVTWTTNGGTVDAGGYYTAPQTDGNYRVVPTTVDGMLADTAGAVVTQAPNNEPQGFTRITYRPFAAMVEDGWGLNTTSYLSVVQESAPSVSSGSAGQALYPAGFKGGDAPLTSWKSISRTSNRVYLSFYIKMSPNWIGHTTGVNKVWHLWIAGENRVVLSATGAGANSLVPQFRMQRMASGGAFNLDPNIVTSARIVRGRWHHWEAVIVANTPGVNDGSVEWWLDGVRVGYHRNLGFVSAAESTAWQSLSWSPTWGGIDDSVPADQWMRVDDVYLSGN